MPTWKRIAHSLVVLLLLTVPLLARANPFEHTLSNGLRIIVKEDRRAPTAAHMVWYRAGGMDEVSGTTGVAHVLEHMMFKGTPNVGAGEFSRRVAAAGGRDNAFTSKDYTAYFQQVPKAQLAQMMQLEADRMRMLDFNPATLKNQQDVVKEEIRNNVQNQPYGGFMWIDIGQHAFSKWENNHDGYGSFHDLENASLDDVRAFHRDYYGPNNAVLAIAGDVTPAQGFALARRYFGDIPARPYLGISDADAAQMDQTAADYLDGLISG